MGKNKHRQPKPGQPSEKPKQAGPLNQAEMDAVLRNMVLQQMSADPKTRGLLTHDVLKSLAPRKPAEPTKTKSPEELMRDCINAELARLQPIEPPTVHAGEEPYFPLPPFSEEGKKTMAVGVERGFPNRHLGVAFAFKAKEGVEMQVFDIPHIKLKAEDGDKGKDFGMNYDVSAVHSKWRECKAAGREPLSVILIYHSFPIHWDVENMFDLSKKLEERGVNTPVYGLGVDMQKKAEGKEYVIGSMNLFRVNPKVSEAEFRQALGVCRATAQEFYNACGGVREKIADELMPVAMSTAVRNNQKLSEPALRMTEPLVDLLKGFLTRKFERIKPTRPPEDEYAVDKEIQALVGFALKYRKRLIDHNFGNAMTKRADPEISAKRMDDVDEKMFGHCVAQVSQMVLIEMLCHTNMLEDFSTKEKAVDVSESVKGAQALIAERQARKLKFEEALESAHVSHDQYDRALEEVGRAGIKVSDEKPAEGLWICPEDLIFACGFREQHRDDADLQGVGIATFARTIALDGRDNFGVKLLRRVKDEKAEHAARMKAFWDEQFRKVGLQLPETAVGYREIQEREKAEAARRQAEREVLEARRQAEREALEARRQKRLAEARAKLEAAARGIPSSGQAIALPTPEEEKKPEVLSPLEPTREQVPPELLVLGKADVMGSRRREKRKDGDLVDVDDAGGRVPARISRKVARGEPLSGIEREKLRKLGIVPEELVSAAPAVQKASTVKPTTPAVEIPAGRAVEVASEPALAIQKPAESRPAVIPAEGVESMTLHQALVALTSGESPSKLLNRARDASGIVQVGVLQVRTTGKALLDLKNISQAAQDSGADLLRAATALWENKEKNMPLIEKAIVRSIEEWEKREITQLELPELAAAVLMTSDIAINHEAEPLLNLNERAEGLAGKVKQGPLGEEYARIEEAYREVLKTIYSS